MSTSCASSNIFASDADVSSVSVRPTMSWEHVVRFAIAFVAILIMGSAVTYAEDSTAPAAVGGRGACKADIEKFCSNVEHGKGKLPSQAS